jgi:hypothetical protein
MQSTTVARTTIDESRSASASGSDAGSVSRSVSGPGSGGPVASSPRAFGGRLRIDPRGDRLWRVSTDSFAVLGHVELLDTAGGEVFLAKRYSPDHARFVDRGRFWSMNDALECLWYGA